MEKPYFESGWAIAKAAELRSIEGTIPQGGMSWQKVGRAVCSGRLKTVEDSRRYRADSLPRSQVVTKSGPYQEEHLQNPGTSARSSPRQLRAFSARTAGPMLMTRSVTPPQLV